MLLCKRIAAGSNVLVHFYRTAGLWDFGRLGVSHMPVLCGAGESAGAFSVCWHLVSPASAGLFSGAIMESGTCDMPQWFRRYDRAVEFSIEFAASVGCNYTTDAARIQCLRGLPALSLVD